MPLLVASFDLSHEAITRTVFDDVLLSGQNARVGISALLRIAERPRNEMLPWTPSIEVTHQPLGERVRTLFNQLVTGFTAYEQGKRSGDKKGKQAVDAFLANVGMLSDMCRLFFLEPEFALGGGETREMRNILIGLTDAVCKFELPELSAAAREAIVRLHSLQHIQRWARAFWELSSAVTGSLADVLIHQRELAPRETSFIVSTMERLVASRLHYLKSCDAGIPEAHIKELAVACTTKLEIGLLTQLCSTEPEVCSSVTRTFALLADESDITSMLTGIAANHDLYRKLGASSGEKIKGRAHQQKLFRDLLSRSDVPTKGNMAAWDEVLLRWRQRQHELLEWTHMLGQLCASSGQMQLRACVYPPTLTRLRLPGTPELCVEGFVLEVLDLMVSDEISLRESAKSTLGGALSPLVLPVFFRCCQQVLLAYFESGGLTIRSHDQHSTLFVEQTCSLLKLVLDRSLEANDLTLVTDFERIVLLLARYIGQLLTEPTERNIQTKSKMCALIVQLIAKKELLVFSSEYRFRETMIEMLM